MPNFSDSKSQPLNPNIFSPIQKPIFETELSDLVAMENGNGCQRMVLIAMAIVTLGEGDVARYHRVD